MSDATLAADIAKVMFVSSAICVAVVVVVLVWWLELKEHEHDNT